MEKKYVNSYSQDFVFGEINIFFSNVFSHQIRFIRFLVVVSYITKPACEQTTLHFWSNFLNSDFFLISADPVDSFV